MSHPSKSVTVAKLNDAILGCFSRAKPSETLDHLVRFLGTWSGSECVIQYAVKLIIPLLNLRARLQHRAGLRQTPTSGAAGRYAKLGSIVSESRTLWRIWGLLPIFQWLINLERTPPATRNLLTTERLQGWSMLAYYPLEHMYYLISSGILPAKKPIKLDANWLGLWSCRFWMVYVVLQFFHLREDRKLLQLRQRTLKKAKGSGLTTEDKQELNQRWDAYWSELITNIGNFPLTIHWSLEKGLFRNDIWVGLFGTVAAVASFRAGWKATALPPPPPPSAPKAETGTKSSEKVEGYDATN
ncbi:hypothetical protein BDQ17DRAFT_1355418 [Cyathus striatus]|nr:hypothetical protein BDQ17DRAFT_1355418 [Cyathus striatus]